MNDTRTELVDTIAIGGGQAGLALGYHLARQNCDFVILDAHERVGDAWRLRWDSLHLFTPAKYDGLPGMPLPGERLSFPSKDEQADYLEAYAVRFGLPVRTGVRVERLWQEDLGNSGAEIALEVSRTHQTWLAGRPSAQLPVRHGRAAARFVLPLVRFVALHVLNLNTPIGRKAAPNIAAHAAPLIRTKLKDLVAAGVRPAPRVVGVVGGRPMLEGDQLLDVANVIWCTGYREEWGWVHAPIFDEHGRPRQHRGVVEAAPGMYFLGLEFLFSAASATLPGASRDAKYVAGRILATSPRASDRRSAEGESQWA